MATTTTFPRASTRGVLFLTIHVVERVVSVDGVEVSVDIVAIFPNEASAQKYAQSIPSTSVSD